MLSNNDPPGVRMCSLIGWAHWAILPPLPPSSSFPMQPSRPLHSPLPHPQAALSSPFAGQLSCSPRPPLPCHALRSDRYACWSGRRVCSPHTRQSLTVPSHQPSCTMLSRWSSGQARLLVHLLLAMPGGQPCACWSGGLARCAAVCPSSMAIRTSLWPPAPASQPSLQACR